MTIEKAPDHQEENYINVWSIKPIQDNVTSQIHLTLQNNLNILKHVKNLDNLSDEINKLDGKPFSFYLLDVQDRGFYTQQQTVPKSKLEKNIELSLQRQFNKKDYTVFKSWETYGILYTWVQNKKDEASIKKMMNNFFVGNIGDMDIYLKIHVWISREHKFPLERAKNALGTWKSFSEFNQLELDQLKIQEQENIKWRERVLSAFHKGNYLTYFQPIVDGNGKIVKYESLARLIDERSKKVYSPWEFMEYIEKFWLHPQLTEITLDNILKNIESHNATFSINFTDEDINSEEIYEKIKNDFLWKYDKLIIEILETVTRDDTTYNNLRKYKKLWIKFAIDDFWTGLSNIRRLLELECDYLKLDSSLLKGINKNDISSYKYLSHIYDMAKSLWLTVVAEWIEDMEIQEILQKLWIEEYQWYYHWRPQENLL